MMFKRRRVIRSEVEGRRDRDRARAHQQRYANLHGYFWLPCPLCGEEFGGHEAHGNIATSDPSRFEGICPSCTAERQEAAERHLAELGRSTTLLTSRWGGECMRHRIGLNPRGQSTGNSLIVEVAPHA